ncbi:MAG: universal stress protein [Kiloniellales bacterium]|jgi:nucleotide-binding universal stress UspA family protein
MSENGETVQRRDDRVFLVVVDDTEEMQVALRYACNRAHNTHGRVALLYVIESSEFQHWMSVGDLMREEARSEGEQILQRWAAQVMEQTGTMPVLYLREGSRRSELMGLIDEEPSISILVLGANTEQRGPGPLVSALTGKFVGKLRVPVTIVPGHLSDEEVDKIT